MVASANPIAVVTGGSRGIGRAICLRLAADGYFVFVNYCSNRSAAEDACSTIIAAGGAAEAIQADVSDEQQVRELFQIIRERSGRLDVLINNAGQTLESLLTLTSSKKFNQLLNVNVIGVHLCSRAAINLMIPRRSGCIINISSTAASRIPVGLGAYAVTKAAVNALTKGFAREVAGKGIRVNAVAPSYVRTDLLDNTTFRLGADDIERMPLKRVARPEEVAAMVSAIIRDDLTYLIGQVVTLDGGRD
jgi:3-oxoacyl-[acyl-carrier protein] reductase